MSGSQVVIYEGGEAVASSDDTAVPLETLKYVSEHYNKYNSSELVSLSKARLRDDVGYTGDRGYLGLPTFPTTSSATLGSKTIKKIGDSAVDELISKDSRILDDYVGEDRPVWQNNVGRTGKNVSVIGKPVLDHVAQLHVWRERVDIMTGADAWMSGYDLISNGDAGASIYIPTLPQEHIDLARVVSHIDMTLTSEAISKFKISLERFSDEMTGVIGIEDILLPSRSVSLQGRERAKAALSGGDSSLSDIVVNFALSHFVALHPEMANADAVKYALILAAYPTYSLTKLFVRDAIVKICKLINYVDNVPGVRVKGDRADVTVLEKMEPSTIDEDFTIIPPSLKNNIDFATMPNKASNRGKSGDRWRRLLSVLLYWGNVPHQPPEYRASGGLEYLVSSGSRLKPRPSGALSDGEVIYNPYSHNYYIELTYIIKELIAAQYTRDAVLKTDLATSWAITSIHHAISTIPAMSKPMLWANSVNTMWERFNSGMVDYVLPNKVKISVERPDYHTSLAGFGLIMRYQTPEVVSKYSRAIAVRPKTFSEYIDLFSEATMFGLETIMKYMSSVIRQAGRLSVITNSELLAQSFESKTYNQTTKKTLEMFSMSVNSLGFVGRPHDDVSSIMSRSISLTISRAATRAFAFRRVLSLVSGKRVDQVGDLQGFLYSFISDDKDLDIGFVEDGRICGRLMLREPTTTYSQDFRWIPPNVSEGIECYLQPSHTSVTIDNLVRDRPFLYVVDRTVHQDRMNVIMIYFGHIYSKLKNGEDDIFIDAINISSENIAYSSVNQYILSQVKKRNIWRIIRDEVVVDDDTGQGINRFENRVKNALAEEDFNSLDTVPKDILLDIVANTIIVINGNSPLEVRPNGVYGILRLGSYAVPVSSSIEANVAGIRVHDPVDDTIPDETRRTNVLRNTNEVPVVCSTMTRSPDFMLEQAFEYLRFRFSSDDPASGRNASTTSILDSFQHFIPHRSSVSSEGIDGDVNEVIDDLLRLTFEGTSLHHQLSDFAVKEYKYQPMETHLDMCFRIPSYAPSMPPKSIVYLAYSTKADSPMIPTDVKFSYGGDMSLSFSEMIPMVLGEYPAGYRGIYGMKHVKLISSATDLRLDDLKISSNDQESSNIITDTLTRFTFRPKLYKSDWANESRIVIMTPNPFISPVFLSRFSPNTVYMALLRRMPTLT
jgi:hypothetical protein